MIDYIMQRVEIQPGPALTGCWQWQRRISDNGYAQGGKRKARLMHRVSYETFRGQIEEGLELDHLCRNRGCVNPWHLEAVTHSANLQRSHLMRGRPRPRVTECKQGHQVAGDNRYIAPNGSWVCKQCRRETARNWWRRARSQREWN